ncbi:hypothetical protein XNC1_1862 [Xenorhabdus nematophila ATCC 19061]|uniref:Uncharacterized protein n=1 Tax=Xenorhabdus nematophila (strain ATCC 19061 / DSM 3370 / CCUG 14189 / LMG 1036 / NCIMB 9965 / AN6) TaxID=406817 RepID=D3VD56_XENNA|nr:hypothetical protein XNC1_1862 [Xenorhabdus nematophila ATCC 19061]
MTGKDYTQQYMYYLVFLSLWRI